MRETWLSPSVLKASYEVSQLEKDLRSLALDLWHEQGLSRSNRGGWHSRYLDVTASGLSALAERAQEVSLAFLRGRPRVTRVRVAALWVNVHRAGDYNVEHQHAEDGSIGDEIPLLSGVYYPDGPPDSGQLHFPGCPNCSVSPDPGSLVLFPASYPHRVEPCNISEASTPRVSFAFNLIARSAASAMHIAALTGAVAFDAQGVNDVEDGFAPLHLAAEAGHMDMLQLLLQHRADPLMSSRYGSLPIHLAAEAGQRLVVNEFLTRFPELVNVPGGGQNRTVLLTAAAHGDTDLLQHLLDGKAEVTSQQSDGAHALHLAVQNGHLSTCEMLLRHAPRLALQVDSSGFLPAQEAARGGYEEILQLLLGFSRVDGLGHWAAHGGHIAVLSLLEESDAKMFEPVSEGAKSSGKEEAMANYLAAALIGAGFRHLNQREAGNEVVKACTGAGSSPQVKPEELTLMHAAASAGHLKVVAWLHGRGQSTTQLTASSHFSPTHMAALGGHADVVEWLGEVDAVGRGSITPLHLAAVSGHAKVAESLLAMRSSPSYAAAREKAPDLDLRPLMAAKPCTSQPPAATRKWPKSCLGPKFARSRTDPLGASKAGIACGVDCRDPEAAFSVASSARGLDVTSQCFKRTGRAYPHGGVPDE